MVRIMLLVTSVSELEGMGRLTGSWHQELAAPYYIFQDAGYTVDIVSPAGGEAPIDVGSLEEQWKTEYTRKFDGDAAAQAALKGTLKLADVDASTYDAILCVGGHGGYTDFIDNKDVDNAIETIDRKKGTVVAVCHGPLALFGAKKADGTPLVAGRTVTGFTNEEETQVGLADKMKFLIEDKLNALGAKFVKKDAWSDHVVSDGNLITGQNNLSAEQVAKKAIEVINKSLGVTRVMLLVTSVSELEGMGRLTGSWHQELAAPYYIFQDAGYSVDIVSPAGGLAPIDVGSLEDQWKTDYTRKFDGDAVAQAALKGTLKLADVDASAYDAILCVGGHGGYTDFVDNKDVDNAIETIDRKKGTVIALCHGPLALFGAKKADGTPLVAGRNVTGFTNEEETQVGLADKMKFLIEDKLNSLGAKFVKKDAWSDHAVIDGNLITGQNNLSAEQVAKKAIEVINASKKTV